MIVVSGSLAYDQIMDFPGNFSDHILPEKLHMLNVSFLVKDMRKGFGGTAGNIAYNLALLDTECTILGSVGQDFAPYKKFLESRGVETRHIKKVENVFTSTAIGFTDRKDNQIWGFYPGADELSTDLSSLDIKQNIDFAVVAPQNPKAMMKFALEYSRKDVTFMFDPGMQLPWLDGSKLLKAFKGAKIIIGNDYETAVMEKKTKIKNMAYKLSQKGKIVITTLGEKGSTIYQTGKKINVKPVKIKTASDPTGAGDAYRAGFLAGFLRGLPLKTCGQMGSVCSSYTVDTYGTTTHRFTPFEFAAKYKKHFNEILTL